MGLSGRGFFVLVLVLAIALPVWTVVWRNRAYGGRSGRIQHAALIVACQFAAVLLVAVAVNNYGYFYNSWSDLWSGAAQSIGISSGSHVGVTPDRIKHSHGPLISGSISALSAGSSRANQATHGRLESVTISGANSGLSSHAYVFLPPQYFQMAYAHQRFPAVEIFTGYPGNDRLLVTELNFPGTLLNRMAHHAAQPMVLVMMRPSVTYPRDTECTDVPSGPQALTFFAQDVTSLVSRDYRVNATGWGAIGESTGGYCATKLAMTYPGTFRAAVSLSGYYHALQDDTTGDLWAGSRVLRNLNDPEWRLIHLPAPAISLLATTSRDEDGPLGHADTDRFLSLVKPPLEVDSIVEPHGGHNFTTWAPELPPAISWMSGKLYAAMTTPSSSHR